MGGKKGILIILALVLTLLPTAHASWQQDDTEDYNNSNGVFLYSGGDSE